MTICNIAINLSKLDFKSAYRDTVGKSSVPINLSKLDFKYLTDR